MDYIFIKAINKIKKRFNFIKSGLQAILNDNASQSRLLNDMNERLNIIQSFNNDILDSKKLATEADVKIRKAIIKFLEEKIKKDYSNLTSVQNTAKEQKIFIEDLILQIKAI